MITVLTFYERISLYHTMLPFFLKNHEIKKRTGKNFFYFTQSAAWCLKHDRNDILFMERCFQHREPRDMEEEDFLLLGKLRDKYKTIVFFCGQPEAGNNRMDILPYVNKLFYKSVFSNRTDYTKSMYAKNLFADYYHRNYGVKDNPEYIMKREISLEEANRPELSWNIGLGTYPRWHWPQRLGAILARASLYGIGRLVGGKPLSRAKSPGFLSAKGPPDFSATGRKIAVNARIDPVVCPSIAFQRRHFLETIEGFKTQKRELFLTGLVPQAQYYRELLDSKIVLSPFGWGEVCFRDFETILSGALLFKPDMSHLHTWPNVYIPNETYIPLKWDCSDLLEKAEYYLNDEKERGRIAHNAFEQYRKELSGLSTRFDQLLGEYYL